MTPERRAAETSVKERVASSVRKRAERLRRKEAGLVRVEVWLTPERQQDLHLIQADGDHTVQGAVSGAIWYAAESIRNPK